LAQSALLLIAQRSFASDRAHQLGIRLLPAAFDVHAKSMGSASHIIPTPVLKLVASRITPAHQLRCPHGRCIGRNERPADLALMMANATLPRNNRD
jgi:hypothetical protein